MSGVRGAGVVETRRGPIEYSIDRLGGDYRNFDIATDPEVEACKPACEADNRCRAWTYVRPGYIGAVGALLPQGQDQAAAPQAVLHFGRGAVTFSAPR